MKSILICIVVLIASIACAQTKKSEASNRTSVSITVYNSNLSLIREERTMTLEKGLGTVVVPDIPSTIDGTSLHFMSLTDPSGVKVLEQNYQYDLVNQSKLLDRYIGKEVEFVRSDEATKKEYTVKGKLLAGGSMWGGGGMIAEIDGKIEMNPAGRLVLPSLPEGLILRPQLEWLISSDQGGEHKTEISYLASGMSWSADYVAVIDSTNTKLDLTGWVTLTNSSGTSFHDAGLKLVAGDVNVVRPQFNRMAKDMALQAGVVNESQFTQTDLFEYKLYSLQRRTDLDNDETKQVELVSGHDVKAQKVLVYDGVGDQWRGWYGNFNYASKNTFGQTSNPKVGAYIIFRNNEKSGLGLPLPKGRIRVYQRDADKKEQFIGEDQIDHTPKDEEIKLYLGNAFDVVGERAQVNFQSFNDGKRIEETVRIKVRNHKTEPVEVQIYEHPWRGSQWELIQGAEGWTKIDQTTIKYSAKLAKDEEKVVTYTIRYTY
ncbi:MAG TPA: DUF4139 domain-containing protein [Bacteroidota bacterium]|nr:DUF4139 domain-containing protein [Bacteroidota bacterium]